MANGENMPLWKILSEGPYAASGAALLVNPCSYRILAAPEVGDDVGAPNVTDALIDAAPHEAAGLMLSISNSGTADAYLVSNAASTSSGLLIPAGGTASFGPMHWPSFLYWLYLEDGATLAVTVLRSV